MAPFKSEGNGLVEIFDEETELTCTRDNGGVSTSAGGTLNIADGVTSPLSHDHDHRPRGPGLCVWRIAGTMQVGGLLQIAEQGSLIWAWARTRLHIHYCRWPPGC